MWKDEKDKMLYECSMQYVIQIQYVFKLLEKSFDHDKTRKNNQVRTPLIEKKIGCL